MNALDRALRNALNGSFPALERVHLTDYKVRVLDTQKGTGAVTRVLIDSTDGDADLDHDRREREHHRGVVAGPARLDPLRPAARRARRSEPDPALRLTFAGVPTDPVRARRPRRPAAPAAEPAARASRCRRRATGGPTAPATSAAEQPEGALLGRPGPERRLRVHARRARDATGLRLGAARARRRRRSR